MAEIVIDLNFRPAQYWTTPDPLLLLLAAIPNVGKHERAKRLASAFDWQAIDKLRESNTLTLEEKTFYAACGLNVFDWQEEKGAEEPLEIASADIAGDGYLTNDSFSASVRVKRLVGGVAWQQSNSQNSGDGGYEETENYQDDEWTVFEKGSPQTFTLDDIVGLVSEALPYGGVESYLARAWDGANDQTEKVLQSLVESITAFSSFYPNLDTLFARQAEEWVQSIRKDLVDQAEEEADDDEDTNGSAPEQPCNS